MIEHNKNFYSLEELKRTRDNLEEYLDNEEVYYFVGAIRYACDEIERLNNIINESRRILGEYKHYSTPDEIQNMFNEEIVDKAYIKLHSNLQELKGSAVN